MAGMITPVGGITIARIFPLRVLWLNLLHWMPAQCERVHRPHQFRSYKGDRLTGLWVRKGAEPNQLVDNSFVFQQNFVRQLKRAPCDQKIQLQREMTYHWLQGP